MALQNFQLVMRSGPTPGKTYVLSQDGIIIGRESTNDIVINDAEVSRKHAQLIKQGQTYAIEDLGSTNGTFVNGQRLMGLHQLSPGELILLGENVSLIFEIEQFDPNATVVSQRPVTAGAEMFPEPEKKETIPAEPAEVEYDPEPRYAGQVPPGPVEPVEFEAPPPEPRRSGTRTWLLAGCGCLIVLLCIILTAAFAFDYLNLYCTPPFDAIFVCP